MSPSPGCASSTAGARAGCIRQEIGQIAGRAGRYRRDGTFGVTGDAPEMDAEIVAAVEGHAFAPLTAAEWRNARLDFSSLAGLMRSLAAPPPKPGLKLSDESQDETTLRQLAGDELIVRRCRDRANLAAAVGRLPDARLPQDHAGGAHAAGRRHVRAPDPAQSPPARRLDAGPVRPARPARRRHRRAVGAARPRAHARLCRQPRRLARRSRALAGQDPRARGPALRHAARAADAALHRPAHLGPAARPSTSAPGRCSAASAPTAR